MRSIAYRILLALVMLLATSTLSAQYEIPDLRALLEDQWASGQWRTLQYVAEAREERTFDLARTRTKMTVSIQRPDRMRVEIKETVGIDSGKTLIVVMDGSSTWAYDFSRNHYKRYSGSSPLAPWLAKLNEMARTNVVSGVVYRRRSFFWDLERPSPATTLRATTLRSEIVKVGRDKRDCWVVEDSGSRGFIWIDKNLGIPLKWGQLAERWHRSPSIDEYGQSTSGLTADPGFVGMQLISLKVDQGIPASTFTFSPPRGSTEIPYKPND
jgi:outer membrane lipoprotein-sorting protein